MVETDTSAVAGGVRTVQVRDKHASASELYGLVLAVADAVGHQATVLVNDRVDVYLAARTAGAAVHGVHIGQSDLPALQVRAITGEKAIIGLSAHTPEHLEQLHRLPAGTVLYLGVGAIRPTLTKPDHPAPLGIMGFELLASSTSVPCVAIGGVALPDVTALRRAGAAGVAVVSAICAAPDPGQAAGDYVKEWGR
ncbi:thiamine phosphate synthase [Arthrobacter pigmenti]